MHFHTILPHKSWNVWGKESKERVEKDKKKYQEEQDKKRKRELEIVRTGPALSILLTSLGRSYRSKNTECNYCVLATND